MSYETWANLLGKTTLDQDVQKELKAVGVKKPVVLKRNETSESEEFNGMMIEFRAASLLPEYGECAGDGVGVLESVSMWLADEDELYEGPLPHGIARGDRRNELRERFGERFYEDEDMDQWHVDGRTLRAEYDEDGSLVSVHLILEHQDG